MQLLSRFPDVRIVGSRRAKKQSCSTRQGLRVGTGFRGVSTTPRGRGLLLLGYFGFKSLVNDLVDLRP